MYSEQPYPETPLASGRWQRSVPLPREVIPENNRFSHTGTHGFNGSSGLDNASPSPATSEYASTHTNFVEMLVPSHPNYMGLAFVSPTASGFEDYFY